MSENGEIYTAGNKFYTPAGTDGMDKFNLCTSVLQKATMRSNSSFRCIVLGQFTWFQNS